MCCMNLPRRVADALSQWSATRMVTNKRKSYLAIVGLNSIGWPAGAKGHWPLPHPRQVFKSTAPFGLNLTTWHRMDLIIDARAIGDRLSGIGTHIGAHAIVLNHLARTCRRFLVDTFANLSDFMRRAPADTEVPLLIICACDWGKHRSVGLVWLLDCLLKHLGHQTHVWHMDKELWSADKSCGRNPCAGCDEMCEQKLQLATDVFGRWDWLFDRPPPVA